MSEIIRKLEYHDGDQLHEYVAKEGVQISENDGWFFIIDDGKLVSKINSQFVLQVFYEEVKKEESEAEKIKPHQNQVISRDTKKKAELSRRLKEEQKNR